MPTMPVTGRGLQAMSRIARRFEAMTGAQGRPELSNRIVPITVADEVEAEIIVQRVVVPVSASSTFTLYTVPENQRWTVYYLHTFVVSGSHSMDQLLIQPPSVQEGAATQPSPNVDSRNVLVLINSSPADPETFAFTPPIIIEPRGLLRAPITMVGAGDHDFRMLVRVEFV